MVFSNSEDGDDDFPDEEVINPPKSVFGKLKPTGVGPGASPAARKRRSLALKKAAQELADKYKAEVILGIHSRTEKTKSWYFKAFGPQMLAFLNSSNGKRIQTDFKTVSDSWGIDDMNQVTQSKNNQVDGAFVSALGEEAINLAQQRGATKEKEKAELERLKDESRRKRMSLVLWEKKSSKNAKACSLRTGTATVDAGNQLPSSSTRREDPLIASPANPHAKAGNSGFAGTRKSPFKVTDVIQKDIQNSGNQLPSSSIRKEVEYSQNDDQEDPLITSPANPHAKAGNSGFAGIRKSPFKVTDVIQKDIQNAKRQLSFSSNRSEVEHSMNDNREDPAIPSAITHAKAGKSSSAETGQSQIKVIDVIGKNIQNARKYSQSDDEDLNGEGRYKIMFAEDVELDFSSSDDLEPEGIVSGVHDLPNRSAGTYPAVILNDVLNIETPPPSRNGSCPLESHGRRKKSTVKKKKVHELSNVCSETYPAVILNDVLNVETPPPSRNGSCPLESHGRRKKSTMKKKKENDYLVKCDFPTCPGNVDDDMIGCDGQCQRWFHFKCGRIKNAVKEADFYYCPRCVNN